MRSKTLAEQAQAVKSAALKPGDLHKRVGKLLPSYMTMGENGMGDMGEMQMPVPKNSIPMLMGKGQFGMIDMGGMFTVVKVRE